MTAALSGLDIGWIAGFLEGEGSFNATHDADGTLLRVSAPQVQPEPLARLQSLLGGQIYRRPRNVKQWNVTRSELSAGVMMTIFPLMSPRRKEQIKKALSIWRSVPSTVHFCRRGHARTHTNTYTNPAGTNRSCKTCRKLRGT